MTDPNTVLKLPRDRDGHLVYSDTFNQNFPGPVLIVDVEGRRGICRDFVWIGDYEGKLIWASLVHERRGYSGNDLRDYTILTAVDMGRRGRDTKTTRIRPSPFFDRMLQAQCSVQTQETSLTWKIIIGFCLAKLMGRPSLLRSEDITGYRFDPRVQALLLNGRNISSVKTDCGRPPISRNSISHNDSSRKRGHTALTPLSIVEDHVKRQKREHVTSTSALLSPSVNDITSSTKEASAATSSPKPEAKSTEDDTVKAMIKEREDATKQRDDLLLRLQQCDQEIISIREQNKALTEKVYNLKHHPPHDTISLEEHVKQVKLIELEGQQYFNALKLENQKRVEATATMEEFRKFLRASQTRCEDLKAQLQCEIDRIDEVAKLGE